MSNEQRHNKSEPVGLSHRDNLAGGMVPLWDSEQRPVERI
jgi:hypothetical protein